MLYESYGQENLDGSWSAQTSACLLSDDWLGLHLGGRKEGGTSLSGPHVVRSYPGQMVKGKLCRVGEHSPGRVASNGRSQWAASLRCAKKPRISRAEQGERLDRLKGGCAATLDDGTEVVPSAATATQRGLFVPPRCNLHFAPQTAHCGYRVPPLSPHLFVSRARGPLYRHVMLLAPASPTVCAFLCVCGGKCCRGARGFAFRS